ncbi:right-handed parallel beta-helix repeat-containing protein [Qipengyuania marisflavi]|uniref:Right-handed parallel beta-helix repeat-containing protein n=1 Tax=Qipengyuania marisflavi TaxID=2486356 RepID=A0A5S3P5P7_9SPHN|nr:right-handed parallel beta-helix repeat-containing protein [Qipengyuania marisflavi]TMM48369.1 right-handed parallel beta-helix repeat-containing protein [Qipengyuania marisflavi]
MVSPGSRPATRPSLWPVLLLALLAVGAIPAAALLAQEADRPFTVESNGRSYESLQQAVDAIGSGSGTILIAPGTYRQCAVQKAGTIAYRARQNGTAIFDGKACQGKAALVLDGEGAQVTGLVFANIRVEDRNGAGIRLENGPLTVSQSWFRDSEQGILTVNGRNSDLAIDKSTFTRLGTCEGSGGCAHAIYAGDYGRVTITRSRFEAGRGGHYVKSRAGRTVIADSSFDDSAGQGTNYMIDLPDGGTGAITGNWFVQGPDKENWSTFIAVGAEDAGYSADGLLIAGNDARLAPGLTRKPAFVADWTGDRLELRDNRLGLGIREFERR